jgi:hypothetical protein
MQKLYHHRYQAMRARQTQELTDLALQHALELERELARPVPEAQKLLHQSANFGHDHQYANAKATYNQATRIRGATLAARRDAVNARFAKKERELKARHERDIALLSKKQEASARDINREHSECEMRQANQMRVQEVKQGFATRARASARRSRSVTRSGAPSRVVPNRE